MGLKIWLPLNGDLTNQGLSNVTVTNYGATVDTNGKIGSCYSFNNTGHLLGTPSPLSNNTNDWTFACWMKVNASHQGCLFSARTEVDNTGISIFYCKSQWIIDDGVRWKFTPHIAISANTWYHVCVVRKKGVGKYLYINGVLDSSTTTTGTPTIVSTTNFAIGNSQDTSTSVTGNQFNGYLNDIRVYDHALSSKEIYKLSRGLIAWFPLSPRPVYKITGDNIFTTSNIAKANSSSSYSVSVISNTSFRLYTNKNVAYASTKQTVASLGLTVGKRYRMKCKIDITRLDTRIIVGLRDSNNTYRASTGNLYQGGIYEYEFVLTSDMSYLSFLGTYESSQCDITFSDIEIYELQEENIIHDISGYQRNGTKTNVVFSPDTPKYNGSSYFDGTSLIQANPLPSEVKTISVWCKTTKNKSTSQFICQDSASGLCVTFYKGTIISHLGGSSSTGSKCTLGDSYIENGWNHFVVLKTGTHTREVYCNGVKLTPTSNDYWSAYAGFLIGARNTSNGVPFYGYISDLRAYATVLSEDDILELYHSSISLVNNDTLLT